MTNFSIEARARQQIVDKRSIGALAGTVEQKSLHQLEAGKTGQARIDALNARDATPLAVFNCPTRRPAVPYPNRNQANNNGNRSPIHGRADYAASCGDPPGVELDYPLPWKFAEGDDPNRRWVPHKWYNGISYPFSMVTMANVRDGMSNTYMFGERYIQPDHYTTGMLHSDDWSMDRSAGDDLIRSSYHNSKTKLSWTPLQDRPGLSLDTHFGSAHHGSCNFAFCDGSVREINYNIDGETHRRLGNRHDGAPASSAAP